jgi:hypothetical protein
MRTVLSLNLCTQSACRSGTCTRWGKACKQFHLAMCSNPYRMLSVRVTDRDTDTPQGKLYTHHHRCLRMYLAGKRLVCLLQWGIFSQQGTACRRFDLQHFDKNWARRRQLVIRSLWDTRNLSGRSCTGCLRGGNSSRRHMLLWFLLSGICNLLDI